MLADRLTLHTTDGDSLYGVKVACLSSAGTTEDLGFIDIYSDETITVGWNCRMDHRELSIPRIALGRGGKPIRRRPKYQGKKRNPGLLDHGTE